MKLEPSTQQLIDASVKGVPTMEAPIRLGEVGSRAWNLLRGDIPLPAAVIKRTAVRQNSAWMQRFLALSGAKIAPHGKTTMCPQLFQLQLADGAWGITVATVSQAMVCRKFGIERLLMANQLVGRAAIACILDELRRDPGLDFYSITDSVEHVRLLAEAARSRPIGRPLQLFLELGVIGGRTGARSVEEAMAVARAVNQAQPYLALRGVEGFEGIIHAADPAEQDRQVAAFLDRMMTLARQCADERLFAPGPVILTAGGSAFFDLAAEHLTGGIGAYEVEVVLRSGCYLTHDSEHYRDLADRLMARSPAAETLSGGLAPALEVWAHVQSRPEPTRVIATMGRRDVGSDAGMPLPETWYRPGHHGRPQRIQDGSKVVALNDQHAYLDVPAASPWQVGDMVSFGISHPCTTFDRWSVLYEVDDAYEVTSALKTWF